MPLYFSRLILNPRSREVRRDAAHPYEMHRTLLRAFPDGAAAGTKGAAAANGLLWRLDNDRRNSQLAVIVQSRARPDWALLTNACPDYCLDPAKTADGANPSAPKDIEDQMKSIRKGQVFAFRLRANPTKKRKVEGKKKSARLGLIGEADQIHWMGRKAADAGFALLNLAVRREDAPTQLAKGFKAHGAGSDKLSLLSVLYEGVLQVSDPAPFVNTLQSGIGPGKAFGFGLLSLARISP